MSRLVDSTNSAIAVSNKPKRVDIEVYQGDTTSFGLELTDSTDKPIDITGWTGQAQIRVASTGELAESPTLVVTAGGVDGVFTITLSDTESAKLLGNTEYLYDVQISDGTEKRTFIAGKITVTEDITEWQ